MVLLRYFTDCGEAVQSKVRSWARTEEFASRVAPECELRHQPGADTGRLKMHNWVIFADEEPVGVVLVSVQDKPYNWLGDESDDPAEFPTLGTATYIDPEHRDRGYSAAAKQAISEHEVASRVRSFRCMIIADNHASLRSIEKAGYECVRTEHVEGKPDRLHFRRWIARP
ncbi:GNAT family N-acetyltransferase [Nocardia asiatica]|uniref:GNAT family N-acetyltransferase n=1 Tax=Nocardia asiatica TaxID=209252 RepID=UPI00245743A8|nr:GNAT family N-acetyltransferase [Nocardia asiatica]